MSAFEGGEDRFSLLLLEDGEYYFRDYNCHYWKQSAQRRYGSNSASDFDSLFKIHATPSSFLQALQKIPNYRRIAGQLKVCSASIFFVPRDIQEPIMRLPYRTTNSEALQGESVFLFSLVYTSLEDILPRVVELWALSKKDDTKEGRLEAKMVLGRIIQDENEGILLELMGRCITPLCSQPGRVVLTSSRLYFQPFNVVSNDPIQTYQMDQIKSVMKRTYQLISTGLEVFFKGRNSLYLTFGKAEERDRLEATLKEQAVSDIRSQESWSRWTRDWVQGRISNFEYLMFLNKQAGRSFKDLTQYPIFPWIIQDYTSSRLDLQNPATFRDLSKPVGALNPTRLAELRERFKELRRMCQTSAEKLEGAPPPLQFPPFLYGCHYSTPGYVVYYLMRSEPQLMLRLQNGKFDAPDRLFWSVLDTWRSVTTLTADVKELIPEFYSTDPAFLLNLEDITFGTRASGQVVSDLELPPWASDAQDFVQKLAEALESPYVSAHLHRWIDLIFGCKSHGAKAEEADNVFYYLTYDDIALKVLSRESDPVLREALRVQMTEFGRTPQQLFAKKHPRRRPASGSKLSRLCCCLPQSAPAPTAWPDRSAVRGSKTKGSSAQPVARAVARITSTKPFIRQATLAWLEQARYRQDPEYLLLGSHTELLGVVRALRDSCTTRSNQDADLPGTYVRALRVLAICPLNRGLILEAGALEPLIELLCSNSLPETEPALFTLSLLSKEGDARLNTFPPQGLNRLLQLLSKEATGAELRATAAATLARLSHSFQNRSHILESNGLDIYLGIIVGPEEESSTVESTPKEHLKVIKEASAGLLALLEDNQTKLEVAERGVLPSLVSLCGQRSPDHDLRGVVLQCLATLAVNATLRDEIVAEGALPMLCRTAKLRVSSLQVPVAAALANLCSSAALSSAGFNVEDCLLALEVLSQSSNSDVQRHAARALWHLAAAAETRQLLPERGPVLALQRLASSSSSLQGKDLAKQALKRIHDDLSLRDRLPSNVRKSLDESLVTPQSSPELASPARRVEGQDERGRRPDSGKRFSTPSHRKHRRLQSAADDKGHGDVLSIDCNRLDSLDRLDTNREIGDTADQGTLPALLNKFGLRKGSRPTPTEGTQDMASSNSYFSAASGEGASPQSSRGTDLLPGSPVQYEDNDLETASPAQNQQLSSGNQQQQSFGISPSRLLGIDRLLSSPFSKRLQAGRGKAPGQGSPRPLEIAQPEDSFLASISLDKFRD